MSDPVIGEAERKLASNLGFVAPELIPLHLAVYRDAAIDEARAQLVPGSKEAVIEAVRLLSGEAPVYLDDSEQWTMPDATESLRPMALQLVRWLDENATKEGGSDEG